MGDKKLLNSRRSHILEEIRNNPNATQAQLPQIIGIGLSVIENNIGLAKIDTCDTITGVMGVWKSKNRHKYNAVQILCLSTLLYKLI